MRSGAVGAAISRVAASPSIENWPRSRHDADPRFEETGLVLGEIEIDAAGRASFNGRRIQTEAQRELTRLCQRAG